MPHLRWLHLRQNPIGEGVSGLAHATALRVLWLNDCSVGPETPRVLAKIGTLEEIYMWNNEIDGTHPTDLAKLPHLREINVCGNPVTGDSLVALRELAGHIKIGA